jgi:hypothetical protein
MQDTQPSEAHYSNTVMSPLERYCCDYQTHEQLALGHLLDRQSHGRFSGLDDSLGAVVQLLIECPGQLSGSSSSSLSSNSGGESLVLPAVELEDLLYIKDSSEWQAVPVKEQAKCLHKM